MDLIDLQVEVVVRVDQDSTTTTQLRQRGVGSGFKVQLMDLKLFSAPVVAVELVF
jgi:hypothetical protein